MVELDVKQEQVLVIVYLVELEEQGDFMVLTLHFKSIVI